MPMVPSFLARERTVAGPGYSRWLIPPAALAVHLCIGQVYATSVYKTALVAALRHLPDRDRGDLQHRDRDARALRGGRRHLGGRATARVRRCSPRPASGHAASWSPPPGIATDQLWLVYLGYGVIGGIGLGIGYISPVSTLIKWFPDRPGLATGMAIMGFGGGALIASPLQRPADGALRLRRTTRPTRPSWPRPRGRRCCSSPSGVVYFAFMMFGAFTVRVPADDWKPEGWDPGDGPAEKPLVTTASVSAANAIRTPQFWLLWVVLFCNVTAGIGILEQAAPMIQDFFREGGTSAVSAAAGGRLRRAAVAGQHGRAVRLVVHVRRDRAQADLHGLPRRRAWSLYVLLAAVGSTLDARCSCCYAAIILSFYGGGFATVPAYLRDLFGTFQVGAIHGRLLTAWSAAGVAGPAHRQPFLDAQGTPGELTAEAYRRRAVHHGRPARRRLRREHR